MSKDSLNSKLAAMSPRELIMLFVAGLVVIVLIGFTFFIEPLSKKSQSMERRLASEATQTSSLDQQLQIYLEALNEDPDKALISSIADLKEKDAVLEQRFRDELKTLVTPDEMPALVSRMFDDAQQVRLESMATIAPVNIFAGREDLSALTLYRHGLTLTFSGSYFDIRDFLQRAQKENIKLYWEAMDYQVSDYPNGKVTIEFYTVSTQRTFIRV